MILCKWYFQSVHSPHVVRVFFFRRPATPESAPSPVGEGWGEGILPIAATFPNTLTAHIQALRLVALSLALSHGREDGAAVGG